MTLELGFWAGDMELLWGAKAPPQLQAFEYQGLPRALSHVEEAPGGSGVGSQ